MQRDAEHSLRAAREEEAALALWSTFAHPAASEAEWRRLPETVRAHYRAQARLALAGIGLSADGSRTPSAA
ncbi:MAG TPA: hypothetical protein VFR37_21210 [Longimicrobium sp.]|nr:hypothetical protein [Longimicrobium sp.]